MGLRSAVGRKEDRFHVMPDEVFGLVPARVVENQEDAFPFPSGDFDGHGVEEHLENFRVAVRDDEAHQLAAFGIDRADNILADVPALLTLGRAVTPFHPFLAGPGVALKACLVSEKDIAAMVFKQGEELSAEGFAAFFPLVAIGGLGHAARDAPGVAVFVEVAHEGAVGKIELFLLALPPAEFRDRPVGVVGNYFWRSV